MRRHPQFWAYAALISVCFFWGTTYLTIRMALESIAPMTLVSARFLLSGGILLLACRLAGAEIPRGRELARNAFNGVAILGIGNGCLVLAETWIPSGLAALIITISPFWMVGLNAIMPPRERLHGPTLIGMVIGLAGAALLVGPGAFAGGAAGGAIINGFIVLQVGCFFWTYGSLLQRRQENRAHPIVAGAVQQLAAGLAFLPLALVAGVPQAITGRSLGALFYLVVFGSIVGYSSYLYALEHLPVAVVSIYNYVNPVVAVLLGWLFYREPFGLREAIAMVVIFIGVAVVRRIDSARKHTA